ncbi:MAG TPA: hypothetical protein VJ999_07720 [Candidatus Sulfotelmatobacter sp.]|nr:hypothetical protein [Candidatus Sulfotelmatobacter sp.]
MRNLYIGRRPCSARTIAAYRASTQIVLICIFQLFALVVGASLPTWSQANVNEGLETASIYVDASKGNDNNNGSKTAPVKTIGAAVRLAVANNDSNIGSKVIINPGTYRETVLIQSGRKSTNAPMTFEAATNGTVFVSGSELITGWTAYKGSSSIYEASWPYNFGLCPAQAGAPAQQQIMLHPEMLIVNGTPLTQVLTLTSMLPGTFYVDNSVIYMYPPSGTDVATATVETATQPMLWQISGQSYVVVRGLTFEYANSCPGGAAVEVGGNSTNVLFDTDTMVWNNARGIFFGIMENFTVQNSVANSNGQVGFASNQVKNSLWQNNVAEYNNWRGAQGAFYVWDRGGAKWMLDHDGTYKNITTIFNQGDGVFWDTDNLNISYTGGVSAMNIVNGMQIEKTQGPFAVSNSYFCYGNLLGITQRGGIAVRNSEQVSLTGTSLYGSLSDQFVIVGNAGGIEITNWETGQTYNLITQKLSASTVTWNGPSASVFSDSYLGGSDWHTFVSTLTSNNNTFYSGSTSNGFVVPTPKAGTNVSLSGWQSTTGQDHSSKWASTSQPSACNVAAQQKDFWITTSTYNGATTSGGQATINIGTFGLGGISGNVTLSMDGVSQVRGLKGSFSATSIPATGSAVLTLTAGPTTPRGTFPITILGTLGNITRTVTVSLFVQ